MNVVAMKMNMRVAVWLVGHPTAAVLRVGFTTRRLHVLTADFETTLAKLYLAAEGAIFVPRPRRTASPSLGLFSRGCVARPRHMPDIASASRLAPDENPGARADHYAAVTALGDSARL